MTYSEQIKETLIQALEEIQWKYQTKETEEYFYATAGLKLDEEDKIANIRYFFEVLKNGIIILATCDIKSDEKSISKMAEYICRANYGLKNGNFEFNYDEGTVRYKIYVKVSDRNITTKEIIDSMVVVAQMWSRYGNGIIDVLGGEREVKDIIEDIEASDIQS